MQVSVEITTDLERCLTVELPRESLVQKVNERLNTLKGQVSVDGFRPGKVPLDVVQGKYGAQVNKEVISEAIDESLRQALDQEQLEPVAKPVVEIDETPEDSFIRYSATFEVMPQVDIQPVEQIKLVRPVVGISESDVDKLVENMRSQRLLWKPAGRPAQAGDRVTVDYSGTVSGEGFPGGSAQGLQVIIGAGSLISGFEDQLIGLTEADSRDIQVTIPGSFPAPEFRGKVADFAVKVLRVEMPQLPELDDNFFRSFGVRKGGLTAFRDQVKQTMEIELKQKILGAIKTAMLTQLLEIHNVLAPKTLIQLEIERMKSMAEDKHVVSATEGDLVSQAKYRVSCGILLTALANKLGISATSDLVREKIESLAASYENPDEVVAWYYSSQEQLASVESMITEELLVDYVLEHGQVTDHPMSFAEMMDS